MDAETVTWIVAGLGLAGTLGGSLGGAALGARLSRDTALEVAAKQWEWQEKQDVRRRIADLAKETLAKVHEAFDGLAIGVVPTQQASEVGGELQSRIGRVWADALVLTEAEAEIDDRFAVIHTLGFWAARDRSEEVNLFPIFIAKRDLLRGLDAVQRRLPIPPADLPTNAELGQMSIEYARRQQPHFDGLNDWLIERGIS